MSTLPIISVTGTKGKTTTVNLLADILHRMNHNTLHVDTTGHSVNLVKKSDLKDSKEVWGFKTPSIAPGRYLGEFITNPELKENGVAILESAFSSARRGLGYRDHKVGVFLNVFEDHIDPNSWISSQQELAEAKSFVFSHLSNNGWAVFNADDSYVCGVLNRLPEDQVSNLIPCGFEFSAFDIQSHLQNGGVAITVRNQKIVLLRADKEVTLCELERIPWTFNGTFLPSVWNLMHTCGALIGFYDGSIPEHLQSVIEATQLPEEKGRLLVLQEEGRPTIIADYAHEKVSLEAVAKLGRSLLKGGQLIGVVRLNHERSDELIKETGHVIGEMYDTLVVYDKIDGHWRQPVESTIKRYPQVIGRTSEILAQAIKERNGNTTRIVREDEAIEYAASIATPQDVVVVIVNDDVERSIGFVKSAFDVNGNAE